MIRPTELTSSGTVSTHSDQRLSTRRVSSHGQTSQPAFSEWTG